MKELLIVNALQNMYTEGHEDVLQSIKRIIDNHLENKLGPVLYVNMVTTYPPYAELYPMINSELASPTLPQDNGKVVYTKDGDAYPYWFPTIEDYYSDTITKVRFVGYSLRSMVRNAIVIKAFYPNIKDFVFEVEGIIERDNKMNNVAIEFLRDCGFVLK